LEREVLADSIDELRNNIKLQEEAAASLLATNAELQAQSIELEQVVSVLRVEKSELEVVLDVLRSERAVYAGQTLDINLSKVAAYACYRLSSHYFDARVAANYRSHRAWLNANRRLLNLQQAYNALSIQEQFSEENQIAVEYRNLEKLARSVPEIWWGLPSEPNLDPDAGSQLLGEHSVRLLNEIGSEDHEVLHSYLINLFFDRTVQSENVRELTVEAFVKELFTLPFLGVLLDEEREVLVEVLKGFVTAHPSLGGTTVNVVYQSEPSAGEIPESAPVVMRNLEKVRDELAAFFSERGVTSFGECSFPN